MFCPVALIAPPYSHSHSSSIGASRSCTPKTGGRDTETDRDHGGDGHGEEDTPLREPDNVSCLVSHGQNSL